MSSSSLGATVYSDILQWVNMQQQLEVSGQASTITTAQRKAVKDLHQLIKPRAPIAEPEMGRQDWIGLLNRYHQTKPESHPNPRFTDEPVEEPPVPLRWHCYCLIAEHREPFPGPARGVDPDSGLPPSFAKKQTAKHYAARCAVEWLVQQGLMPPKLAAEVPDAAALRMSRVSPSGTTTTRPLPVSSSPSSPEAKRQKMTAYDPAESSSSSPSTSSTSMLKTDEERGRPTAVNDDDDNSTVGGSSISTMPPRSSLAETTAVAKHPQNHQSQPQPPMTDLLVASSSTDSSASNSSGGTPVVPPSEPRTSPPASTIANININAHVAEENNSVGEKKATAQVAELSNALGIGAPRYEVTPDPENPNYFSGRPVFHSLLEEGHFPHGTGHVANVFGKNNVKEEVAKRVLVELRKIKQRRDDVKRELLADLGPTVG